MRQHTSRQFIRHPTNIPIEFSINDEEKHIQAKDIGDSGLCFSCNHSINIGKHIHITIPICEPEFDAEGVVRWCKQDGAIFLIGVAFQQKSMKFAVRMVEQVCHIEHYRSQMKIDKGIELSSEQAAMQWISKYAHEFPK